MIHPLWHYAANGAQTDPARPAVECRGSRLSYGALDRQSSMVASSLAARGIGRGDRVGIYMPKSIRTVVAMHGILKAGAAYVPIDPLAPARRAAFIINDCELRALFAPARMLRSLNEQLHVHSNVETVMLTDADLDDDAIPELGEARLVRWQAAMQGGSPDRDLPTPEGDDPAYVLYTSGSTGNPKGVVLSHRNATAFVDWAREAFAVGPHDRLSNHAPLHFDLSVFDIYVALSANACVVMVPNSMAPFPIHLARWIDDEAISIWYSVPSALTRLLLHGELERFEYEHLRAVLFAGEVFPIRFLRDIMSRFRKARFYNLYGPTETNVCTYHALPQTLGDDVYEIPIGTACSGTEVFALNEAGEAAAPHEIGELYVHGPTVMLGYWGLPERTAAVLRPDPRAPASTGRVYRTGDLVRVEAGGVCHFIGRSDRQVKSRGYRIELDEIEQTLLQHEQVQEAFVLAVSDDEVGTILKAFVACSSRADLTGSELAGFCRQHLPAYMVPEDFTISTSLPHTSTGKVDRVALENPSADRQSSSESSLRP